MLLCALGQGCHCTQGDHPLVTENKMCKVAISNSIVWYDVGISHVCRNVDIITAHHVALMLFGVTHCEGWTIGFVCSFV